MTSAITHHCHPVTIGRINKRCRSLPIGTIISGFTKYWEAFMLRSIHITHITTSLGLGLRAKLLCLRSLPRGEGGVGHLQARQRAVVSALHAQRLQIHLLRSEMHRSIRYDGGGGHLTDGAPQPTTYAPRNTPRRGPYSDTQIVDRNAIASSINLIPRNLII